METTRCPVDVDEPPNRARSNRSVTKADVVDGAVETMSERVTVTEVFADVEADPDAVIETFGADSPEDLVAGSGDHDPTVDEDIDADDETAGDLLGELSPAPLEPTTVGDDPDGDVVVSEAFVTVVPGDGTAIDEFLGLDESAADDEVAVDEPGLVGPDPTPNRVDDDDVDEIQTALEECDEFRPTGDVDEIQTTLDARDEFRPTVDDADEIQTTLDEWSGPDSPGVDDPIGSGRSDRTRSSRNVAGENGRGSGSEFEWVSWSS